MPDRIWDETVALGTAPIFDDAIYLAEALGLPMNQNEDHLDAEVALLARESGVPDSYRFVPPPETISRAISTMTLDSDQRSSRSIHSQETQSTSFTSAPSRTSRDLIFSTDGSTTRRAPPARSQITSPVEKSRDFVDRPESDFQSRQSSTLSITPSAISSSASSQQAQPRKKRGSVIFSMFRRDSGPRGAKLVCGHISSDADVRAHIQESLKRGAHVAPDCCGSALPQSILERVPAKDDPRLAMETATELPEPLSRDSDYCEIVTSTADSSHPIIDSLVSDISSALPQSPMRRTRHEAISIGLALAKEAFASYRTQQKEELARVSLFECSQRKALSAYQYCSMQQLGEQLEIDKNERIGQHNEDLERLEERQLLAEHDLLKAQAQETQNVATALKYIEAYCLRTRSNQERVHAVSEEDLKKLDHQRLIQQDLPRRHASAINVLRARQEMDTARRLEAQEAELQQLGIEHEKRKFAKEAEYHKELARLETVIELRRKRLLQRWDLRFEIWRRDWEAQHDTTLTVELEHEDWPPRKADHTISIPEASLLAQYIKAAA
ncbi:uncharacterized protein J4E87_007287 [Alternaria ethzedia]|uniref:uncharacterized protein n=2 Tax=Alternaria sect. Infectoriae TaxID=2499258 RepID=UPI0020C2E757|nr:uncharacterized protein J4E79_000326 [Alternaria viburni]XP_049231545.1 uncharacterized protein J4E87_007287 [Alternaria ethzedia]XP_051330259.1 uncharacterized protein J4E85_001416 [Alternaria conjuncta]KAI4620599.1 hypothetical protein J4E87_007287 [Alternaria ethzedia]KAI4670046.1 hypothetical protein J4E79_000326 [Alternaria viburni]KAI4936088.1 hypothetical protein J4E85_001416 [Alternaria conjuncta]